VKLLRSVTAAAISLAILMQLDRPADHDEQRESTGGKRYAADTSRDGGRRVVYIEDI
jgi:hypothetical protein